MDVRQKNQQKMSYICMYMHKGILQGNKKIEILHFASNSWLDWRGKW